MRTRPARHTHFVAAAYLGTAIGFGRFASTPVAPSMYSAGVLSIADAGHLAGANYAGYLLGALLTSTIPASRSPRSARIAAVASAISIAAMALTQDPRHWALLRHIAGVGGAIMFVTAAAAIANNTSAFSGVGIGIAACALATAATTSLGGSWRTTWLVNGALAVTPALLTLVLPARPPATSAISHPDSPGRSWQFRLIATAYGLSGLGYVVTATYLTLIIRRAGLPQTIETLAWLLFGLAMPASLPLWGKLRAVNGELASLLVAFAVQAGSATLLLIRPTPLSALTAATGMGLTVIGIVMLALAAGTQSAADPATAPAKLTAAYGIGQLAGPLLSASLAGNNSNLRPGLALSAAALVIGAACLTAARRTPTPRGERA